MSVPKTPARDYAPGPHDLFFLSPNGPHGGTIPPMPDRHDIAAFYRFIPDADVDELKASIHAAARRFGVTGVVIVAPEGVNATVAAPDLREFLAWAERELGVDANRVHRSTSDEAPFRRFSVRVKTELVASGRADLLQDAKPGVYVDPHDWDELIARDDVTLIDCRNSYEIELGTFQGALDPGTEQFRDFADFADTLDPADHPELAMFCTGGIRCEKATAYLLERGFHRVYHLRGGILGYLAERGPQSESWRGDCFVFDRRVSVDASLTPGPHTLCWACRMPVPPDQLDSPLHEEGVSCPRCHHHSTDAQRAAKRERHRQLTPPK